MFLIRTQSGQSLVEVIIALAIFSLIASALATMVMSGFNSMQQGGEHVEAEALAQEGIEAVRAIKDEAWNENTYQQSAVEISSDDWQFSGEGTTEQIGQFTRTISFEDVCRDLAGDITACPGAYTDPHSKKITVSVSWQTGFGFTNSVEKTAYFTNWDTKEWVEDLLAEPDFLGGTFDNTATSTLGDGDGAVILEEN